MSYPEVLHDINASPFDEKEISSACDTLSSVINKSSSPALAFIDKEALLRIMSMHAHLSVRRKCVIKKLCDVRLKLSKSGLPFLIELKIDTKSGRLPNALSVNLTITCSDVDTITKELTKIEDDLKNYQNIIQRAISLFPVVGDLSDEVINSLMLICPIPGVIQRNVKYYAAANYSHMQVSSEMNDLRTSYKYQLTIRFPHSKTDIYSISELSVEIPVKKTADTPQLQILECTVHMFPGYKLYEDEASSICSAADVNKCPASNVESITSEYADDLCFKVKFRPEWRSNVTYSQNVYLCETAVQIISITSDVPLDVPFVLTYTADVCLVNKSAIPLFDRSL